MSIWKNTEVRRTALWLLLATAVCAVAAALLYPICGLLTLGLGAVCGAIWYGSTGGARFILRWYKGTI